MIKKRNALLIPLAITVLLAAFSGIGMAQGDKEGVKIFKRAGFGNILTDAIGKTLYYSKKDSPDKSICSDIDRCTEKWEVFCYNTGEIIISEELKASDFRSFRRPDGQEHLTYKGKPLYRYNGDEMPGDTKGHGLDNIWFIVKP